MLAKKMNTNTTKSQNLTQQQNNNLDCSKNSNKKKNFKLI
jgi:hypothetical protein